MLYHVTYLYGLDWITATTPEDKLKFLNSVIKKLTSLEDLATSAANAHAHGARAHVHFELQDYDLVKEDARRALEIHHHTPGMPPLPSSVWRVLVDAEEATGQFEAALEVLRQWTDRQPQFATKVAKEAQRVRSKMVP